MLFKNRKVADSQKLEIGPGDTCPLGNLITLSLLIRVRQGTVWWKLPIWPVFYCWKLDLGLFPPKGELATAVGRARSRAARAVSRRDGPAVRPLCRARKPPFPTPVNHF